MEVSSPVSPVRDVYARLRRLSDAIDDPDSSFGERRLWTEEYVDLSGALVGMVGARTAGGAAVLERVGRGPERPDGHRPHIGHRVDGRTDLYL